MSVLVHRRRRARSDRARSHSIQAHPPRRAQQSDEDDRQQQRAHQILQTVLSGETGARSIHICATKLFLTPPSCEQIKPLYLVTPGRI
jgi:hypothetical protein